MAMNSGEIEIFESENFQQLLMFKWYRFAKNLHLMGTVMHLVYVFLMALYVLEVYINLNLESARTY